jgi:hypothetical protein
MPVVVPTASPVETAQPTTRPTPPAGSPTMVPTVTPAVVTTDAPTLIITTDSPTPATNTGGPTPAIDTGAPTLAIDTNVPTPAIDTGTPTESPTISLMLNGPTSPPTAVPDDVTSAPTPLVEPEATDAPTPAPVEASAAPTPVIDTGVPTPAVVSSAPTPVIDTNMPTPATDTGTPTESPTISLMLNGPTSPPTAVPDDATSAPTPLVEPEATDAPTPAPVEASVAPTPVIDTGAPTPAVVSSAPTPVIDTNVPTPAIGTGTPTESPTISLMLGDPTSPPTVVPEGTSVPTPIFEDFPTAAPFPIPTTGIPVDASAFSVTYETSGADPTEAQFNDAERITREYLEQFFIDFFGFVFEQEFVSLSVGVLGNTVGPPRIDYNLTAFFFPGAERIPTNEEIDIVVQTAFLQPSVQTLILELRTLPLENPFSSTSTVFYSTEPMAAPLTTSSDSSATTVPVVLIGMAAGVGALACIITAIFAARRTSRYRPIKQVLPTSDGMPYSSNIMAFMDREQATSRSFSSSRSSCSLHLTEI